MEHVEVAREVETKTPGSEGPRCSSEGLAERNRDVLCWLDREPPNGESLALGAHRDDREVQRIREGIEDIEVGVVLSLKEYKGATMERDWPLIRRSARSNSLASRAASSLEVGSSAANSSPTGETPDRDQSVTSAIKSLSVQAAPHPGHLRGMAPSFGI